MKTKAKQICIILHLLEVKSGFFSSVFKRFIIVLLKTFIVQCYRVLYESFIQLFYVDSTGQ